MATLLATCSLSLPLEPSWVTQSRLSHVTLLYFLQSISKYRYTKDTVLQSQPTKQNTERVA